MTKISSQAGKTARASEVHALVSKNTDKFVANFETACKCHRHLTSLLSPSSSLSSLKPSSKSRLNLLWLSISTLPPLSSLPGCNLFRAEKSSKPTKFSPSSSPKANSSPLILALLASTTSRLHRMELGNMSREMAAFSRARNEEVRSDMVSTGRYWAYR